MPLNSLPKLITFDGEARSGKGTIVSATKDHLHELGYKVMLIDAGQVFRVLVVAATRAGVDMDSDASLDDFLNDKVQIEKCVQLVKEVYHMQKNERDTLLYTNTVSANSAKIGRHAQSQEFKDNLLKKWLHDARAEGYQIVLLDGRTLEEIGQILEDEGLCDFTLGLYFICKAETGARRTLGFANIPYDDLTNDQKEKVNELVEQILARNKSDRERTVQPIKPPKGAPTYLLPNAPTTYNSETRPMIIFDTSLDITKEQMYSPVAKLVADILK